MKNVLHLLLVYLLLNIKPNDFCQWVVIPIYIFLHVFHLKDFIRFFFFWWGADFHSPEVTRHIIFYVTLLWTLSAKFTQI